MDSRRVGESESGERSEGRAGEPFLESGEWRAEGGERREASGAWRL